MNYDQKNILVAKTIGTHFLEVGFENENGERWLIYDSGGRKQTYVWTYPDGPTTVSTEPGFDLMPQYFNNLNACADFEKYLESISNYAASSIPPIMEYRIKLTKLVSGIDLYKNGLWIPGSGWGIADSQSASADKRFEAFGQTMNLW